MVITRERMLYITRQYKDTLQRRSMILMSFCNAFIRVYICANNYSNRERFDKVIAKIKWCSFFAPQCISLVQLGTKMNWLDFEVKGQGHSRTKCTSGRGVPVDD